MNTNWIQEAAQLKQRQRSAKTRFTQALKSVRAQASPVVDIFQKRDIDVVDGGDQRLRTLQLKAVEVAREFLGQFDFPIMPELKLLNSRSVKSADIDPDRVISAEIRIEAKCTTATGAREYLEIPVSVARGCLVPPSMVFHHGREALLTQSFVDDVVRRATSYAVPPLQRGWNHAPLSHETLQYAVDVRNDLGYMPRENPVNMGVMRASKRKQAKGAPAGWQMVVELLEAAEQAGEDTFPRPFDHIAKVYIAEVLPVFSYYDWEIHMINAGYAINPRGDNRGRMVMSKSHKRRPNAKRAARITRLRRR